MKKLKKSFCLISCIMVLVLGLTMVSYAAEVTPRWENTRTVQTTLSFSGTTANCSVYIAGKSGSNVTRIKGTLTLKDNTSGTTAGSWSFDEYASYYQTTKYATAVSGHSYTLSVSATVYNASGGEAVNGSVTKTN